MRSVLRAGVIKMRMRAHRCARVTTYVTWMAWHAQEGIQAVREKASFLEHELREQLADARRFLEDERAARRAAEASLATQLEQARADAGALRLRLIAAKDSDNHREVCTCILWSDHCLIGDLKALLPEKYGLMFLTVQAATYEGNSHTCTPSRCANRRLWLPAQAKQALNVVSSLVQDLAPPDSVAKKPSATDQGSSHEQQQPKTGDKKASAEGQVQQQQRDGKKTSAELQTGRKAHFDAGEAPPGKAGKASVNDDVAPAGKTARSGVGRKQKSGEPHADKHKAPAAAEKAARKGAEKQVKPAKEPYVAAKAPASKAAARKGTAAAAVAAEKISPEKSEVTAGRRARRRESKAPWWMAQVCASFPSLS